MVRIFSKMKIFLLKKIVFPVLQLIAKYKRKKTLKNPSIPPKQYGQYLQQTGKQIWVKKLK